MKKIIAITIITLLALNLSAQKIEKGIWQIEIGTGIGGHFNWVTGGSVFQNHTVNGTSSFGYPIEGDWSDVYNSETTLDYDLDFRDFANWESRFLNDISFGYFVADGFLIGLSLDLGGLNLNDDMITSTTSNTITTDNEFSLGVRPKLRYYIEAGRGNAIFFESSFGVGIENTYDKTEYSVGDWNDVSTSEVGTTIGLGFGWSIFNFSSREIFSVEPMLGFNINSGREQTITTDYIDASATTTITDLDEKTTSMGPYFKLKLAFYLGRHFWSH